MVSEKFPFTIKFPVAGNTVADDVSDVVVDEEMSVVEVAVEEEISVVEIAVELAVDADKVVDSRDV